MAAETVTVVFTDLVGSTALMSRVGEERAEVLRREHFALLREAFEPCGGREVKNLGDGLMVVFDGAADAVAAVVAAQRSFERRNRRVREPLDVRVGVAAGDADVVDGDYFGLPVVQAARLCAAAEGGEVLVAELVRLLAGSRGGFTFESVGALELKGLDEPVPTCRVRWEATVDEERPGLPPRLAAAQPTTFVGREPERQRLASAWKSASVEGERRVVLLGGEPGIGKTTLTARLAADAHEDGALVVYGRCDEDLGVPYQPWVEALGQVVAAAPEEVLAEHVAERGGALGRLAPRLAARVAVDLPTGGDRDGERFVLFGSVADLLAKVSTETPVVLVLDDLHWADGPTLHLLRHVVTSGEPMRLLVVGTFRDSEVTSGEPLADLLAAFHREQGVERISLRGLSDADVLDLLEHLAGHEMDEAGVALRDAVLEETAGNPFFVGEVLRHLAESGAIYQDESGRWVGDTDVRAVGLPVSVREVVGRRVAALGPDTERLLSLASVIGRDFDVAVLAAVAKVDEDEVIDRCDAAVAAAILQDTDEIDRYTFAHALIEHTLYDALSPSRRARAHRAVAEELERIDVAGERVGELAHHWSAAVRPTDTTKAVHYALLAGQRALDQLAPDEAVRWFGQALDLADQEAAPDAARRARILLGLGEAQFQCGIPAHRETLLEAGRIADAADEVDLLARAAMVNSSRGWEASAGTVDRERVAAIERALARLDDGDRALRAQLLPLLAMEAHYDLSLAERVRIAEEAVATARGGGDVATLAHVLRSAARIVWAPSTHATRVAWLDEACALADRVGDPLLRLAAHDLRSLVALEAGDRPAVRRHRATVEALGELVPVSSWRWTIAFHEVWQAVLDGDLHRAEELADAAYQTGLDLGQQDAMVIYAGQVMNIRCYQCRAGELVELIEQALADTPGLAVFRPVLAMACAQGGQSAKAVALLDEALDRGFGLPDDQNWTIGMTSWAEAALVTGHREAAGALREELAPHHDLAVTSMVTVNVSIASVLGRLDHLLGRLDEADAWFAAATEIHDRLEAPPFRAYSDAAWALLLADRNRPGDRERARALAAPAFDAAVASGFALTEAMAAAALDRLL